MASLLTLNDVQVVGEKEDLTGEWGERESESLDKWRSVGGDRAELLSRCLPGMPSLCLGPQFFAEICASRASGAICFSNLFFFGSRGTHKQPGRASLCLVHLLVHMA